MKRRVVLSTINVDQRSFALAIEFLASNIKSDPGLRQKIRLVKRIYHQKIPQERIIHQILADSPHLIGFSCYIWNITRILELASMIKRARPETLIVLGGPETAGQGGRILKSHPDIDAVVLGEGEEVFVQLLAGWKDTGRLGSVPGAAVRHANQICLGPPRPPIENLGGVPSAYDDLQPSQKNRIATLPFQTLRGCDRGCFYCFYGKSFPTIRYFPLARIEKDLDKIKSAGVKTIGIIDPNFLCHKTHAADVIRMISRKGLRFQLEANAEDLDGETIEHLASSTCYQINFGLQSSNEKTLKRCGRRFNLKQFESNVRRLSKSIPDIAIELDLICGLPGDTLADFLSSLDFTLSLPVKGINILPLQMLPGTPFSCEPEKWGIKFHPQPPRLVYQTDTFSSKEIKQAGMVTCAVNYLVLAHGFHQFMHYVLKKIPDTPARFFVRLATWDQGRKKRFVLPKLREYKAMITQNDFRYFLSGLKHLYPDVFSAWELAFIGEMYKFKRCIRRLERKPPPEGVLSDVSGKEGILWKCPDNLLISRFRANPSVFIGDLVPKPLEKNAHQFVLLRDSKERVRIDMVADEMVEFLKFFRRPQTIDSYLSVSASEGKTVVEGHARVLYAQKRGFIRAVKKDKEINPGPDK